MRSWRAAAGSAWASTMASGSPGATRSRMNVAVRTSSSRRSDAARRRSRKAPTVGCDSAPGAGFEPPVAQIEGAQHRVRLDAVQAPIDGAGALGLPEKGVGLVVGQDFLDAIEVASGERDVGHAHRV